VSNVELGSPADSRNICFHSSGGSQYEAFESSNGMTIPSSGILGSVNGLKSLRAHKIER
jgi:hypothetical protein